MLNGDLMKRAHYRTLEEREHALDGVRVNVAAHVLILAVIDRLMRRVLVLDALIGFPLVGHNPFGVGVNSSTNEVVQRLTVAPVLDSEANAAASLDSCQHHSLAGSAASRNLSLAVFAV